MKYAVSQVLDALSRVVVPSQNKNLVRLGMIRNLNVSDNLISFTIMLKNPGSSFARIVEDEAKQAVRTILDADVDLRISLDNEMIGFGEDLMLSDKVESPASSADVLNIVAVASGKGGVGKSTVSVNVAVALARQGYDVGLVDTDIYGPSIPTMFGIKDGRPSVNDERKIVPLERHGVKLLSMGFLVDPNKAVIWRGPMVSSAIKQFLGDTVWDNLDFLVLDLPPGTGDIQLTIVQTVSLAGAVIVSTPQDVALADARKGVAMFEQVNVPVLGIVENMAFFIPPDLPIANTTFLVKVGLSTYLRNCACRFWVKYPLSRPFGRAVMRAHPWYPMRPIVTRQGRSCTLPNASSRKRTSEMRPVPPPKKSK